MHFVYANKRVNENDNRLAAYLYLRLGSTHFLIACSVANTQQHTVVLTPFFMRR
jgi:hypothetical protein